MGRRLNLWLLLVVILCAVSLWVGLGDPGSFRQESSISKPAAGLDKLAGSDNPAVHLLILNGTDRSGLAREVGLLVSRAGCVAQDIGNAPAGDHPVSFLINRRLEPGRAAELAVRLGGIPVLLEWDGRGTEDAVLLLGEDHQEVLSSLGR
ncbi:MAG: LytR C-terminal domain-containing protein [Gemmatimonadales bacterium]|nr:LytR C-terminal domain-containing protein [Gemmatimonadales bacterium]